ncbi:hypothetical protein PS659_06000 [Pseudomonas fluorescens]|uniref:Uncharacterized protein n=1 Tax=Pseudomonas fluorescens TaxID=294 RepID=A0A5E6XVW7_PSEFL|nr:hypothetical protein PS659_05768 [Pseudomonas fluorescens]VVN47603.1 hypothetical protein PS659_06000 [Pseudomonas fluorescens]
MLVNGAAVFQALAIFDRAVGGRPSLGNAGPCGSPAGAGEAIADDGVFNKVGQHVFPDQHTGLDAMATANIQQFTDAIAAGFKAHRRVESPTDDFDTFLRRLDGLVYRAKGLLAVDQRGDLNPPAWWVDGFFGEPVHCQGNRLVLFRCQLDHFFAVISRHSMAPCTQRFFGLLAGFKAALR